MMGYADCPVWSDGVVYELPSAGFWICNRAGTLLD